MKLGNVFNAMRSWGALASMKMNPQVAYKILKYLRLVSAESDIIEKQRIALVHEITNTKEGEAVQIKPDTDEFREYIARFNEVLFTESDLKPCDLYFNEVMEALNNDQNEVLSIQDMLLLEPFFAEPKDIINLEDERQARSET